MGPMFVDSKIHPHFLDTDKKMINVIFNSMKVCVINLLPSFIIFILEYVYFILLKNLKAPTSTVICICTNIDLSYK